MKKIIFLLSFSIIVLSHHICQAQWQKTSGPPGGAVLCMAVSNHNIYAGTDGGGVYLSSNDGDSWTQINNGLTSTIVNAIAIRDSRIYAGTDAGLFYTINNGKSWIMVKKGKIYQAPTYNLAIEGTKIFAGTGVGVFLSTGNDTIWNSLGLTYYSFNALAKNGTNLFAGSFNDGVYLTADNGGKWDKMNKGLSNINIVSLASCGSTIFAGTKNGGIYKSTDTAKNWTPVNNGLPYDSVHKGYYIIKAITVKGKDVFAGIWGKGVYTSSDNGNNWTEMNEGFTDANPAVESLVLNNDTSSLFAGISNVWKKDFISTGTNQSHFKNIKSEINIYPNPTSDYIFIKNENSSQNKYLITLQNIQGQNIFMKNIQFINFYKLELPKLTKGFYFINIKCDNNIIVNKLLIQ